VKRVLLADDHTLMLDGLIGILKREYEIAGTAENGRVLLEQARRVKPDLILLDVSMPELNGIETARKLQETAPEAKVVFVTQQLNPEYVRAAFQAGAMAYVAKQSAGSELLEALRLAMAGRYYVTPLVSPRDAQGLPTRAAKGNPGSLFGARLTPRQREVLQLIAEGKSGKEISIALNISVKTVEFHRNAIANALSLRTTAELTRYAIAQGIVAD
jgi:DNA-binding NarL/FixJ family response regulator